MTEQIRKKEKDFICNGTMGKDKATHGHFNTSWDWTLRYI